MSQAELARRVNTTQETISNYELGLRGNVRPDLPLINRIAKVLDVSPAWLLFGN